MADITPLAPLRYDTARVAGGLASVVAPPYDVISATDERAALAARNPHNVVRLILPEGEGDTKYGRAAELLTEWQAAGVLVRDPEPGFYQATISPSSRRGLVEQELLAHLRRGFLALVRLVPFSDRVVLPHERTLSGPKEDRLKLFRATQANLSPGFMLYHDPRGHLNGALDRAEALAEFTTADGVGHKLAKVRDPDAVRAIVEGVSRSTLYIADGHHRYETALRYSREAATNSRPPARRAPLLHDLSRQRRRPEPRRLPDAPTRAFAGAVFVRRASGGARGRTSMSKSWSGARRREPFSTRCVLSRRCRRQRGRRSARRSRRFTDSAVCGRSRRPSDSGLETAGASRGRRLGPSLGHSRAHPRDHPRSPGGENKPLVPARRWPEPSADLRQGRGQVLFLMNSTPVAQVRRVAEAGEVMPQKSTFFYPKVMTGLAIHTLDPSRSVPAV